MRPPNALRLVLLLALGACRSTGTPASIEPRGHYAGDGASLAIDADGTALRAVGTLGDQPIAFLETGRRRYDGVVLDAAGARRPASLILEPGGGCTLLVDGQGRRLGADGEAAPEVERYHADVVDARLLRRHGLVVARVDVLGEPLQLVAAADAEGRFSGFLEGPLGPELPVRGRAGDDRLELEIGALAPIEARRRR